jgi:hypothetical protein
MRPQSPSGHFLNRLSMTNFPRPARQWEIGSSEEVAAEGGDLLLVWGPVCGIYAELHGHVRQCRPHGLVFHQEHAHKFLKAVNCCSPVFNGRLLSAGRWISMLAFRIHKGSPDCLGSSETFGD